MSYREDKLEWIRCEMAQRLVEVERMYPGAKLALVARMPGFPDGSRDIVVTDDQIPELIKALELLAKRPEIRAPSAQSSQEPK